MMPVNVLQDVNIGKGLQINPVTKQVQLNASGDFSFNAENQLLLNDELTVGSLIANSIQAGINAPKLKIKKLQGTIATPAGSNRYHFAHGVDGSKIKTVQSKVTTRGTSDYYPADTDIDYSFYHLFWNQTDIIVVTSLIASSKLSGQTFTFYVEYEE